MLGNVDIRRRTRLLRSTGMGYQHLELVLGLVRYLGAESGIS